MFPVGDLKCPPEWRPTHSCYSGYLLCSQGWWLSGLPDSCPKCWGYRQAQYPVVSVVYGDQSQGSEHAKGRPVSTEHIPSQAWLFPLKYFQSMTGWIWGCGTRTEGLPELLHVTEKRVLKVETPVTGVTCCRPHEGKTSQPLDPFTHPSPWLDCRLHCWVFWRMGSLGSTVSSHLPLTQW